MLDIKFIRENPHHLINGLVSRGTPKGEARLLVARILELDEHRRAHLGELQVKQERRNVASKEIGNAMRAGNMQYAERLKVEVNAIKLFLQGAEERERQLDMHLKSALSFIPNIPAEDVPKGKNSDDNCELRRSGTARKAEPFLKEHFDIGESLELMDFEHAASVSGSRFVFLKGDLARLERALGQFMLDFHISQHGYEEISPPLLVRESALEGTGQMPKFEGDLFFTAHGASRLALIPTAEVSLTNIVRERIVSQEELPMRFVALTPCFRSEAGAAGQDTRGMLRQHQFQKVELVSITDKENSLAELERLTGCAEDILKQLDIPFRTMTLCTGDLGFSACKTYDLEVWLPGQKAWREVSSCSLCGDFQARRMDARYRSRKDRQTRFLHTLNGSGVAVGRALIAVLENYQNEDGSVTIPHVLRSYMCGLTKIRRK